jgi:polyisoprenoid-binding protein YceI
MANHFIRNVFLMGVMALGWLPAVEAGTESSGLCAPFKDGKVDSTLVTSMLEAAKDGYLYRIDKDSSRVGFCVNSEFSRVQGAFHDFSGGVALTPAKWVARDQQAMVVIRTDSLDTSGSIVENLIKSKRFFDVEKYPEILFVSHSFEWTGTDKAKIHGDLTVHGVTRPVALDVTLTPAEKPKGASGGESILIKATTVIKRSDFGMDNLSRLVSDQVELCLSVEVVRYHS